MSSPTPPTKVRAYTDGVVKAKLTPIDFYDFMWALAQTRMSEEDAIRLSLRQFVRVARGGPSKKQGIAARGMGWLKDHDPKIGIKRNQPQHLDWPEP